jgi:NAD(P)-dependent dehydrogenase (short-subunit alcohol dehydrogenase family)
MAIDTLSLSNKVAIVTGSARENGIGAAIAIALARNGAAVTINYVSPSSEKRAEGVANTIRSAGGKAIVVGADVSTIEGADKLVQQTLKSFAVDHIDILGAFAFSMIIVI